MENNQETNRNRPSPLWINVYHRFYDPVSFTELDQIELGNPCNTRLWADHCGRSGTGLYRKLVYRLKVTLK